MAQEDDILLKFRIDIGDNPTDTSQRMFTDEYLTIALNQSIYQIWGSGLDITSIDVLLYPQFSLLAKSFIWRRAASDAASYFKYKEGGSGDTIDKSKISKNYLDLADMYKEEYEDTYGELSQYSYSVGVLI